MDPEGKLATPSSTISLNAHTENEKQSPTDEIIMTALQKTGLDTLITARGGLDVEFDTLSLSVGQQQLFDLSKAILHKQDPTTSAFSANILLLDEATSTLDSETIQSIRNIVNEEFAGATVIEVVHRLESVEEQFDVVVVLDAGRIVEVGEPKALLAEDGGAREGSGRLRELVRQGRET